MFEAVMSASAPLSMSMAYELVTDGVLVIATFEMVTDFAPSMVIAAVVGALKRSTRKPSSTVGFTTAAEKLTPCGTRGWMTVTVLVPGAQRVHAFAPPDW
jgi:hypothetical protein